MRAGRPLLALCLAMALGACNDTTGFGNVEIVEDSVLLAAPSAAQAEIPTALDVTAFFGGGLAGGRFPERVADVEQWDVALRVRDGQLVFVTPRALGFTQGPLSRAAITEPITGQSFDELREAPAPGTFVADRPVRVVDGAVYVVRSRFTRQCGQLSFYAKVQPLEVNPALGTVRLRVATATPCGDVRLARED